MNEFDITSTYTKGDHVIFDGKEYVYDPKDWQWQFSTGGLPSDGHGWHTKLSYDIFASLPPYSRAYECYKSLKGWIDWEGPSPNANYTRFYINSEPNEPTVLECKDKMINEI